MPKFPLGDITPCVVIWDYGVGGGFVNLRLDPVKGLVKLPIEDQAADVEEESFGDAAVDSVFRGTKCGPFEVPMTRSTLAQLDGVLPGTTLLTANEVVFWNKCGSAMAEQAKAICVKPVRDGVVSTVKTEWALIYKAFPMRALEVPWDRATQKVFLVKFKVFPRLDSGYEGRFFQLGIAP